MKHPLIKLVLISCVLVALASCDPNKKSKTQREKVSFRVTHQSQLFFKNIRKSSYDHQALKEAKLDIYRLKDRNQEANYPLLHLAIVINWMNDEAYLILEPNEVFEQSLDAQDQLPIYFEDSLGVERNFVYRQSRKEDQLELSIDLYDELIEGRQFYLKTTDEKTPFLDRSEDREVFRKTIFDFYRLTHVF